MPAKSWKPSLVNSRQVSLLMSTTIFSSAAADALNNNKIEMGIPLRLEYPKIGRIDDAEIVGDRIAEDSPVFRHLLAQETQNGITEIVVGRVAPIVRHVSMHQPP